MPEPSLDSSPPRKKLDFTQLLTLGAVLVSLVFAVPQAINAQATLEATRSQNEIDRQSQLTDRFSKAIEHLGSDKLQIRLGGIYALERIVHDSTRDNPTVRSVLATFVREETRTPASIESGSCPYHIPAADVQAAVTVLGHPPRSWKGPKGMDLSIACLVGADLVGADLAGADLSRTDLINADLINADLTGADLSGADLTGARLDGARLDGVVGWKTVQGRPPA